MAFLARFRNSVAQIAPRIVIAFARDLCIFLAGIFVGFRCDRALSAPNHQPDHIPDPPLLDQTREYQEDVKEEMDQPDHIPDPPLLDQTREYQEDVKEEGGEEDEPHDGIVTDDVTVKKKRPNGRARQRYHKWQQKRETETENAWAERLAGARVNTFSKMTEARVKSDSASIPLSVLAEIA